jgi:hypothetical protein
MKKNKKKDLLIGSHHRRYRQILMKSNRNEVVIEEDRYNLVALFIKSK